MAAGRCEAAAHYQVNRAVRARHILPDMVGVYGHERLKARLGESVDAGRLPSALALVGPGGIGKQRLALWLGQRILCTGAVGSVRPCGVCQSCKWATSLTHPDLTWVFPRPRLKDSDASPDAVWQDLAEGIAERREAGMLYPPPSGSDAIYVATVRALVARMALTPAVGKRKVFVIGDAERMVPQEGAEAAANAFLKALEEPPADTTIILTTSAPDALLPTIRSRVVLVRVAPLAESEMRAFLADPAVQARVGANASPLGGAPGARLAPRDGNASADGARTILDTASAPGGAMYRAALRQGAAGARGGFADRLDAMTGVIHERARIAAERGANDDARRAIDGVRAIERAKELIETNVNPPLITAALLMSLRP
jgi:DNA polymerase III subunit delta'